MELHVFFYLTQLEDLFSYPSRPTVDEIETMEHDDREALRQKGEDYLRRRFAGQAEDVGAVFAFRKRQAAVDRSTLVKAYGWDSSKPIIGVYNSHWLDYPHAHGLLGFRDFLDWIQQTVKVARGNDRVNWLFKAHPCDDWYPSVRGVKLDDLVREAEAGHLQVAEKTWNNTCLINTLDAVVTCHGTIGIEAAALGKPVLTSHPGWYGHAGFVVAATGRQGYIDSIQNEWWKSIETDRARSQAELFAGWTFCAPTWQRHFMLQDDSRQDAVYPSLMEMIQTNRAEVEAELRHLNNWVKDGHKYYHIYKMAKTHHAGSKDAEQAGFKG